MGTGLRIAWPQPTPIGAAGADTDGPTTDEQCPRQDSNLRLRLRRPTIYPLSYEGGGPTEQPVGHGHDSDQ